MKISIKRMIFFILVMLLLLFLKNSVYAEATITATKTSIAVGESTTLSMPKKFLLNDGNNYEITGYKWSVDSKEKVKMSGTNTQSISVTGQEKGNVTISCGYTFKIHGQNITYSATQSLTITEKKSVAQTVYESIEQEEKEYTNSNYKIPTTSTSMEEVRKFFEQNANFKKYSYEDIKNSVSEATLRGWIRTISMYRDPPQYLLDAKAAINELLSDGEVSNETQETLQNNYKNELADLARRKKEYLGKLTQSTGEDRVGEFSTDVTTNPTGYKPTDELTGSNKTKLETRISKILTVISNIGIVASVLIIAFLGIKYMVGSVEEKAEYKQDLVPYFVGAILLFGITVFVKIFMSIGNRIMNS